MEDIFKRLGEVLNPFPANPLKVFSLIEKLRSQTKGTGMFAETIQQAILEEKNYYKILKYVKDKGEEDFFQVCEAVPEELLAEIIEFEIPKYLLNT